MGNIGPQLFVSDWDLFKLDIVDWTRLNGTWRNPADALASLNSWLLNKAYYAVCTIDLRAVPTQPDWPGWVHSGRHAALGRLFWNWFHTKHVGILCFADSPDFHGRFDFDDGTSAAFLGDVGHVSPQTLSLSLKGMGVHDVWISVLNTNSLVIIELAYDAKSAWARRFGAGGEG